MAEKQLWHRRGVLKAGGALGLLLVGGALFGSKRRQSIGFSMEWNSIGSDIEVNYVRTQGGKNERETNTSISRKTSAHLSFMPGDVEGIPEWMEVEWLYGIVDAPTYELEHANAKPAKARFNLKEIIPQSVIEEVLQDRNRKQLKLIFTFNDDKLDLRYEVYQWRK